MSSFIHWIIEPVKDWKGLRFYFNSLERLKSLDAYEKGLSGIQTHDCLTIGERLHEQLQRFWRQKKRLF